MVRSSKREAERSPTGFTACLSDERITSPGSPEAALERTTCWELSWDAVPGAVGYVIFYVTSEGRSMIPHPTSEPRWRLAVARGTGAEDTHQTDWQDLRGL